LPHVSGGNFENFGTVEALGIPADGGIYIYHNIL
jgi:hypothetical protein